MPAPVDERQQPTVNVAVSLIVVTFNSAKELPGLAESLVAGLRNVDSHELIIVDNDSTDDSVELAQRLWPDAVVLATGRNGGYAAGINTAAAKANPDNHLLVLNPDVELMPEAVSRMLQDLTPRDVGVVVPKMLEADGSISFSLRRDPTLLRLWATALLGGYSAARLGLAEMVTTSRQYGVAHDVEWATGAAFLIDRSCHDDVGPWDESFFLYSEEVEYCQRVRDQGFRIRYCPSAVVRHSGGASGQSRELYELLADNREVLYARSHGPIARAAFRGGVVTANFLRRVVPRAARRT